MFYSVFVCFACLFVVCFKLLLVFLIVFLDYFMCLFVINAWLDLFILCLFACFCLFDHVLFVCLIHLFGCLLLITFSLTIFAGMARQYKSMQSMSHDWETVKTVAHETVRHMT